MVAVFLAVSIYFSLVFAKRPTFTIGIFPPSSSFPFAFPSSDTSFPTLISSPSLVPATFSTSTSATPTSPSSVRTPLFFLGGISSVVVLVFSTGLKYLRIIGRIFGMEVNGRELWMEKKRGKNVGVRRGSIESTFEGVGWWENL